MANWIGRGWIGFVGRSFSGENSILFLGINEDLRSVAFLFLDLLVWRLMLFSFFVFMGKLRGSLVVLSCSVWWLLMRCLSLVKFSWFLLNH